MALMELWYQLPLTLAFPSFVCLCLHGCFFFFLTYTDTTHLYPCVVLCVSEFAVLVVVKLDSC